MLSEEDFLQLVDCFFPRVGRPALLLGRGDDCALWSGGQDLCISSDLFLEDVHFRRQYFCAADIGYKALAVNISDIAAMGASPAGFNLNLMAPANLETDFWQELLQEMADLAAQHDLLLCGGDLSKAPFLGLDITIWGHASGQVFLQRKKCKPGDMLFCIGSPGLARVGLEVLEKCQGRQEYAQACQAHLRPGVLLEQAAVLAESGLVRGLMDVSDGLARDLPRFLGPGQGVELLLQEQDLHPDVLAFARQEGSNALEFALLGGEDYALLGAVHPSGLQELQSQLSGLLVLGKVSPVPGLRLQDRELKLSGFDHFAG